MSHGEGTHSACHMGQAGTEAGQSPPPSHPLCCLPAPRANATLSSQSTPTHCCRPHPKFTPEPLSSGGGCKKTKHRNPQSGTKSQNPQGSGKQASPPQKRHCGAGPGCQLVGKGQGPASLWSARPPHGGLLALSPHDIRGPAPPSSDLPNVGNASI